MSLISNLKPGGKHGVPTHESRDPIGYLVAGLSKLASSDLIDRKSDRVVILESC